MPARGIANITPTNPNTLPAANTEKIIHTGCRPILSPIILGANTYPSTEWPNANNMVTYINSTHEPKVK